MLSIKESQGVNPTTSNPPSVGVLELKGLNGHKALFTAGISLNVSEEVTPTVIAPVKKEVPAWPRKLPNRRSGFNQVLRMSDGMKIHLRTGEFPDGTLGEIFVDTQKEGTFARAMLNQWAISISTGLQHGVPFQVFVDQFKNVMFEPKGMVQGSDTVTDATSIIDAIFQELIAYYPNGKNPNPTPVRPPVLIS